MARGTQFLPLVTRLRDELRRSNSVSVGVDDLPSIKRAINRSYHKLYQDYSWPHLRRLFDKKSLTAGDYYYDLPSGLDYERIEKATVWFNSLPHKVERGIDFADYAQYDTSADERSDPVLKWDIRYTGAATQFEVWPIPASAQSIQFIGLQSISQLVNDTDQCLLDDDAVILEAAWRMFQNKDERAEAKLEADQHIKMLKARSSGGQTSHQLGIGVAEETMPTRATVRVT